MGEVLPSSRKNPSGKMNVNGVVDTESCNSFRLLCTSSGMTQLTQDQLPQDPLPQDPLHHLDYGPMLVMCITRPETIQMSVARNSAGSFGLKVDCVPKGTSLRVSDIVVGGEVWDWNNLHSETAICVDDRVISVNQVWGFSHQLVGELRKADHVTLTILHYGPDLGSLCV